MSNTLPIITKSKSHDCFLLCVTFLLYLWVTAGLSYAQNGLTEKDQARFGRGQSLNNLKKYSEAIVELKELHAAYPENKDITVELAKALGYSTYFEEAAVLFEDLNARYPDDENLRSLYAGILEANQRFTQGREQYFKLLKNDPRNETLYLKIAELSSWINDYETTIQYDRKFLDIHPEDVPVKIKLADAYFYALNYEQAIALYKEAQISPLTHQQPFKNLAYAYLALGQFEETVAAYTRLAAAYPQDVEINAALANAYYAVGDIEEAEKQFEAVIALNPQDVSAMLKLAEILSVRKHYDKAISIYHEILEVDPKHRDAKIWLARVLSWDKQYQESLDVYLSLVKENPEWVMPRREKARILGWMRDYKASIAEYQAILGELGDDDIVETEMQAKDSFYKRFDSRAIEEYEQWLSEEPKNLEALFDLGQVYARQMQWDNANKIYGRVLYILPEHFKAQQAKRKVNLISKSLLGDAGFEFYEADSDSRKSDVRYYSISAGAKAPLSDHMYLGIKEQAFFYDFSKDPTSVSHERITTVFEYVNKPSFWAQFGYAYNIYSDGIDNSHNYFEELNIKPFDPLQLSFKHERRDVIDNADTLTMGLTKDDYRLRADLKPNRRLYLGADYMYSHYNGDGNDRNAFGADLETLLFYEPRRLSLSYRFEHYGFDDPSGFYFSPSSFHSNIIGVEWEHFLNKEELYWGANDTYYTLRYLVNFDVGDQRGHTLFMGLHHDFNDRLNIHFEASKKIYEHQSVYSEDRITANVKYHF